MKITHKTLNDDGHPYINIETGYTRSTHERGDHWAIAMNTSGHLNIMWINPSHEQLLSMKYEIDDLLSEITNLGD